MSSVEMSAYLARPVEELEAAMRASGRAHAIRLDAEPIRVPTDMAVSLGVTVTELVTNAYKYAYPDGAPGGDIRVSLRREVGSERLLSSSRTTGSAGRGSAPRKGRASARASFAPWRRTCNRPLTFDPAHRGTRAMLAFAP